MLRLELPTVSLLVVETRQHEMARLAITDSIRKVKFAEVVIHTDKPHLIFVNDARYVTVPDWPEKNAVGRYCYNEAPKSISTPHMIFMEWDAGVRDQNAWDPAFLEYDYIGAPWPGERTGGPFAKWSPPQQFSVGNGGFVLWSKKLTDFISGRWPITADYHISKTYRPAAERDGGLRWAPEEMAYRFSFEAGPPGQSAKPSFGYHDIFNWPLTLSREEIIQRVRLLMQGNYITGTPKLAQLELTAPWLRQAIPELEDIARQRRERVRVQKGIKA